MRQELRRRLVWFAVSTAAVSLIPIVSTHPAGAVAVKVVQQVIEGRKQTPAPELKHALVSPVLVKADPAQARVYHDGVTVYGARVDQPTAAASDCDCNWWDRGPLRRGMRGVGRGVKATFCFLTRPLRRG